MADDKKPPGRPSLFEEYAAWKKAPESDAPPHSGDSGPSEYEQRMREARYEIWRKEDAARAKTRKTVQEGRPGDEVIGVLVLVVLVGLGLYKVEDWIDENPPVRIAVLVLFVAVFAAIAISGLLAAAFWRRRLGAKPRVVLGVRIDARPHAAVGIAVGFVVALVLSALVASSEKRCADHEGCRAAVGLRSVP